MAFIDWEYTLSFWKSIIGIKPTLPVSPPLTQPTPQPIVVQPASVSTDPEDTFAAFNPSLIITDKEFTDCDSMTEQQIQDFLVAKGGVILPNYKINDKLVSYWMYKHCKEQGLNPKVVITNLQKEQAAITSKVPFKKQRTYDYILGVGATDGGDNAKWAGVDKQILGSVQTCVKWQKNGLTRQFPLSIAASDKADLQVSNAATFSLYKYTPWVGNQDKQIGKVLYQQPFGNFLFWKVYRKFFKS